MGIEMKHCEKCGKELKRAYKYQGNFFCSYHWAKYRHCDGHHTKSCGVYSYIWEGIVCKYMLYGVMGKPVFFKKDVEKIRYEH